MRLAPVPIAMNVRSVFTPVCFGTTIASGLGNDPAVTTFPFGSSNVFTISAVGSAVSAPATHWSGSRSRRTLSALLRVPRVAGAAQSDASRMSIVSGAPPVSSAATCAAQSAGAISYAMPGTMHAPDASHVAW